LEVLREYAAREGYEVLEEVTDPGQSGASLERSGMDQVRDLVAAGGVSVVLAQDRDRFAREPAYHYLLRREFEEHGTKMRALNDRGDERPEGELTDGILDQLAKFERAKTTERTRRGRLRKVKEGKILAAHAPRYGFKFDTARDGYEVDEEKMAVVRRVFYLVGVEGRTQRSVERMFEREGIPTPEGAKHWDRTFFRSCILDDVYKPHTYGEVKALVSPEVAAHLDPHKRYGVWWFNRRTATTRQVSEATENSRRYRKEYRWRIKPKEEWVPVPVPDSGIPREWVEAARERIKQPRALQGRGPLLAALRWRGTLQGMRVTRKIKTKKDRRYVYSSYRCCESHSYGKAACPRSGNVKAEELESKVWNYVRGVLTQPERLEAGLNAYIEAERNALRGDPEREAKAWLQKLSEVDRKRARYQEMAAEDLIGFEELREKLSQLDETRRVASKELEALRERGERIAELERDSDALLESYARMTPEGMDMWTAEERHRVYKMLRLQVYAAPGEKTEVEMLIDYTADLEEALRSVKTEGSSRSARTDVRS
jgi:site-specific DNA recombinase